MAAPTPTADALRRTYFALGTAVLVVLILYFAKVVLVPLAVAVLLAFVLTPVTQWLEQLGLPRLASVPLASLLAFVLLGVAAYIVGDQVRTLAGKMGHLEKNVSHKLAPLYHVLDELDKLGKLAERNPEPPAPGAADAAASKQPVPVVIEERRSVLRLLPAIAGPLLEIGAQLFLVVVLTVFLLFQRENFRDRVIRLIGRRHLTSTTKAMSDAAHRVSRYLLLQVATNSLVGLGVTLGLFFLGIEYFLLWGVIATMLRFIPYVGIWVAAAMPLTVSIAGSLTWTQPLLVLGVFLVFEVTVSNVVEPLVFGRGVGVAPMALLIAAVFWLWLWGPIGLLLSAPMTVCLVVLGKHVPALKSVDVLMGDEPALGPAARFYQRLLADDQDEAALLVDDYLRQHPPEGVYDEVILPTLVRARADREQHEISAEEERAIFHAIRELCEEVLAHVGPVGPQAVGEREASVNGRPEAQRLNLHVIGCPARGQADELAVEMLGQLLQPFGAELEVVSARDVLEEARFTKEEHRPDVVWIASLSPAGLTRAATLCKRLRARFPEARIVVGRLEQREEVEAARAYLRSAGANEVSTSLLETRRLLLEQEEAHAAHPQPAAGRA